MHVEMIDLLRCPNPHADSWLVASADETMARHVVRGTLGCPVCLAEYPVRDGVAELGAAVEAGLASDASEPDDALRIAALLGLTESGGTVALGGAWDRVAAALVELTGVRVLLVDPPTAPPLRDDMSAVRGGGVPVTPASLRGVALDARTADESRLAAAVRALRTRGRLVAPATARVPAGVTELARDARLWVAERGDVASSPIALQRR